MCRSNNNTDVIKIMNGDRLCYNKSSMTQETESSFPSQVLGLEWFQISTQRPERETLAQRITVFCLKQIIKKSEKWTLAMRPRKEDGFQVHWQAPASVKTENPLLNSQQSLWSATSAFLLSFVPVSFPRSSHWCTEALLGYFCQA